MPATDSGHSQHAIVDVADQLFAAIERSDQRRTLGAYTSVANGGVFVAPRLVRGTMSPSGPGNSSPSASRWG